MSRLADFIKNLISGKNVAVLGYGREGQSTLRLFSEIGGFKSIAVCDLSPVTAPADVRVISGEDYQKHLSEFDIIMKSPGVVLEDGVDRSRVWSQTEIFISVYREQIIGVTGTKGKSTTTTIIYHILKSCGKNAVLLGNIGIPPFEGGDIDDSAVITLELSSHQLEYVDVSPQTAVFLNVFPEHLDHYKSYEHYYAAKKNIYLSQKAGDLLIAHESVAPASSSARVISFGENADIKINPQSFIYKGEEHFLPQGATALLGAHNTNNIAAAYAVCRERCGISDAAFFENLKTYRPLPHRLEFIGEKDGISFYDDSISTIPQTAIEALLSVKNVSTLLVGGMDRGVDYTPLIDFLATFPLQNLILMYDTGKRIFSELKNVSHINVHTAEDLSEAVAIAKEITPKGTACLLSPAAASYGFFKNFEERGDKFREYAMFY